MMSILTRAGLLVAALFLTGCANPIAADRVSPHWGYRDRVRSALEDWTLSPMTIEVLRRYDLSAPGRGDPSPAIEVLHQRAVEDDRRDVLFALSELCYEQGDRTDARSEGPRSEAGLSHFLASAAYAYLYLFGSSREPLPNFLDSRVHHASELYRWALGRAFLRLDEYDPVLELPEARRRLPVGSLRVQLDAQRVLVPLEQVERFLPADHFTVRGLSVRNRVSGLGAPLIGVLRKADGATVQMRTAATLLLRTEGGPKEIHDGTAAARLELYFAYDDPKVQVAGREFPLETDLTVPIAHTLNESFVWSLGSMNFFSGHSDRFTGIRLIQPYEKGKIPVVFIHGTFSSPVWWAETWNTLQADPVLRRRFQFWNFVYPSGNPMPVSATTLREALRSTIQQYDPEGKDPALRRLVLVGHSQGGLLAKLAVTQTGDALWREYSDRPIEEMGLDSEVLAEVHRYFFVEPVSNVQRVVFLATPHRGSFLTKQWVRRLVRRFVTLPGNLLRTGDRLLEQLRRDPKIAVRIPRRMVTSLDSMATDNPILLALVKLRPAPGVKCHSIIAIKGDGEPAGGNDGVVEYSSAHLDYADSEFIVRSPHSCQSHPVAIREIRRILLEHLEEKEK